MLQCSPQCPHTKLQLWLLLFAVFNDCLTFAIGKVSWPRAIQAPDYLLIKFLQLSDSKMCAVNLQALFTTPPHEHWSDRFHTCLRKAQHTGVEHMFDRLKQNNSVAWAKSSFDPKLKDIDFDDDKRWFLDSLKTVTLNIARAHTQPAGCMLQLHSACCMLSEIKSS